MLRTTQIALASAAFALLAACGGGSSGDNNSSATPPSGTKLQVVAFGTSLTDAGTYSEQITPGFGGGRFTTNPGEVWAQKVSEYFGNTLSPAFEGGFGLPLTATGGLDYAQGGALVFTGGVSNTSAAIPAASEQPITWQLQQYLAQHGSFNANQLVLVEGGANEILGLVDNSAAGLTAFGKALAASSYATLVSNTTVQQQVVASLVQQGFSTAQATALVPAAVLLQVVKADTNAATDFASIMPILEAATELSNLVNTQIAGTPKVAVVTVPDIGKTPAALAVDAAAKVTPGSTGAPDQALSLITAAYNLTLIQGLSTSIAAKKVVLVDTFSWLDSSIANAASLGFSTTNTGTACNLTLMQQNATNYALAHPSVLGLPSGTSQTVINAAAAVYGAQFASSLFCSPQTLTSADAPTTYMFADLVHPTTALHAQFAAYVETQLAAAGIGKAP
ncbi:phospholipase/lecithinase/hemolysin [Paraburkholderia bannensis]|uniref:Phospholipase/lecithinase/hemolysin n=1 Tax=Paraburkholderia bannensis TaxID=765414 RepID=A0A7W9TSZ5_9BURK|nr:MULTISPECIES: SGNH/GDSL hydrolase family protein [Paraburkholderia]MBB3255304.1 phospholipase/lecithinase/hemolysin [Paraburkholderia sp. WP4_3_2]MBB6100684.1 phospholipase/lecithinase/hemolysin [Paraburkholderia bannensis]